MTMAATGEAGCRNEAIDDAFFRIAGKESAGSLLRMDACRNYYIFVLVLACFRIFKPLQHTHP